jgi:two-component system, NarL family, nitrate/nitrite response regulator NarL
MAVATAMRQAAPAGDAGGGPPRVVIADDHPPTRTGVRLALEQDGFVVCGEEATAAGAVAAAVRDRPDVCLVDVDLPGGGIEAAAKIRAHLPETPVVMLSAIDEDDRMFTAIETGASGYLLTGMNPADLVRAVHGVLRGEAALSRALTARLIDEFRARARGPSLKRPSERDLTSREWEVLDCLREELSTRKIARRLYISETTVRRHVGSILRKLAVPDRQTAVEIAAQRSQNLNGE